MNILGLCDGESSGRMTWRLASEELSELQSKFPHIITGHGFRIKEKIRDYTNYKRDSFVR